MCAESADQVQVDAVRPVPPTEFFRVGLADGPAAVRALKERLRHIQGRGLSPVRTLAPQRRPPCKSGPRWWMEPPVERGEACRSACRRSPCRPGQCVPPIGGGGRGRRLGEPLAWLKYRTGGAEPCSPRPNTVTPASIIGRVYAALLCQPRVRTVCRRLDAGRLVALRFDVQQRTSAVAVHPHLRMGSALRQETNRQTVSLVD